MSINRHQCVYFVSCAGTDLIKIGTTIAIDGRLRSMTGWIPFDLDLIAAVPGGRIGEAYLHWLFRAYRVRGEWFQPALPIVALIEEAKATGRIRKLPQDPVDFRSWAGFTQTDRNLIGDVRESVLRLSKKELAAILGVSPGMVGAAARDRFCPRMVGRMIAIGQERGVAVDVRLFHRDWLAADLSEAA